MRFSDKIKIKLSAAMRILVYSVKVRIKKTVLLDTPTHGNLGDIAIAIAEGQFINETIGKSKFVEVSADEIDGYEKIYAFLTPKSCRILVHGGGFLGDIWEKEEYRFRRIVQSFKRHRIMVFPQTVTFDIKNQEGRAFFEESKKIYSSHNKLVIFVREYMSYAFIHDYMPEINCIAVPDIVTVMKTDVKIRDRRGVVLCMRSDCEKNISKEKYENILSVCKKYFDGDITETDTVVNYKIYYDKRQAEVNEKLYEFAGAKLVVTDRLHGMIFASLTNTPCIALANKNGKVKAVYEWIKENEYIKYIDEPIMFEEVLRSMDLKKSYAYNCNIMKKALEPLRNYIKTDKEGI